MPMRYLENGFFRSEKVVDDLHKNLFNIVKNYLESGPNVAELASKLKAGIFMPGKKYRVEA